MNRPRAPRAVVSRRGFALGLAATAAPASCGTTMTPPPETKPKSPAPAAAAPARRATLRELLAENRARDPEFGGGLSNHQSMALGALAKLGADDARLAGFADEYASRLRPLRDAAPLVSDDFRASIGSPPALVGLVHRFEADLAARGRRALLAEVLPALMPGVSGGAFHGLIRTAYALDAEEDAELAHALAYFVTVAEPLRELPAPRAAASLGPTASFARAEADPRLKRGFHGVRIVDALRPAAEQPLIDDVVADLHLGETTLDELASFALDVYMRTLDFTAIHMVTSTHAIRLLLPYLPEPDVALRYQFQALLVASLTIAASQNVPRPGPTLPSWSALTARALDSKDDHDVKLVFTCREEASVRAPDAYRAAAALRLHLT
jgi:hypothetical protein